MLKRNHGRLPDALREVEFIRRYTRYAEGSVLITMGETEVLCNVSVSKGVPPFLNGKKQGWLTAEYAMLPRATHNRNTRDVNRRGANARALEIQRLIARSLRAMLDLRKVPELTFTVDCDVIQADGGTRTASINGACVALCDAVNQCLQKRWLQENPLRGRVASISVGLVRHAACLDLDYGEDSNAQTDMNVVMDESGGFIEIQGTAERQNFSMQQLLQMLELAKTGCKQMMTLQQQVLQEGETVEPLEASGDPQTEKP